MQGLDITACSTCKEPVRGSRYVSMGSRLLFCSEDCFRVAEREGRRKRWVLRGRRAKRMAVGMILGGAFLTPHQPLDLGPPPPRRVAAMPSTTAGRRLPPGYYGPDWPPSETSLLAALGRDAWIHPLAGPFRRMPRSDSRVFGAVRPGDRAVECVNGHCGVDLGGEIWGEQVRAVHDGVVDFVQRGNHEENGGQFVRLSHHDGTVFTQYFHLAAIASGLERGRLVKGGQVIGLLGDTGVKESSPHLHFTVSVRPSKDGPERYIDPEPLLALWPLRIPVSGSEVGLVSTVAKPGFPLGSALRKPKRKRPVAKRKRRAEKKESVEEETPTEEDASSESSEE